MDYPAIRYSLGNMEKIIADNRTYIKLKSYEVTVIDKNPDSDIPDKMLELPYCRFGRSYVADNLNHWTFTLYY